MLATTRRLVAPAAALLAVMAIGVAQSGDGLDFKPASDPAVSAAALPGRAVTADRFSETPSTASTSTTAPAATVPAPSTTAAPTTTTTAAPIPALSPPPPLAPRSGGIPVGKGMWIWLPDRTLGGDPDLIVERAVSAGLTHLYVRTGSSRQGFENTAFLEALLPVAHGAGLRVYGWDFPYLENVAGDVERAMTAITFRTTTGHRIDGFVPDIETNSEGTNLTTESASTYSQSLRAAVGEDYPLVACVPHPSPRRMESFPYAAIVPSFDAVAPMVYWLNRQPDTDVAHAVTWLSQFGKPVIPVGQAYDGGPEGGRPGPPPPEEIHRFLAAAERYGATGASFWSYQHATAEIWTAISSAPQLTLPAEVPLARPQVHALQTQLRSLGYWAPPTGQWDAETVRGLTVFQIDRGLVPTGRFDAVTRDDLIGPLAPPVG